LKDEVFLESSSGRDSAPNPGAGRIIVSRGPNLLRLEIRPLVRTRGARIRLTSLAIILLASALLGAVRLAGAWETGLKKGDFGDLPLPLLAALTVAVGIFAPLAVLGLAALAFSEETVEIGTESMTITSTAFERSRVRQFPLEEIDCWRETLLPLSPWWTWAVQRLAVSRRGKLEPLAAAAGPREKRRTAEILAQATGKPLVRDFRRTRSLGDKMPDDEAKNSG
jgi:hypothetical protein